MACGYPFIYNRIPSELYNVSLVFIDEKFVMLRGLINKPLYLEMSIRKPL